MNRTFKKNTVICAGTAAAILFVAFSAPHIGREPTPAPDARHVPAFTQGDRIIPPPEPKPATMGVEAANVAPNSTPPTEIDFEVQNPNDSPAIGQCH